MMKLYLNLLTDKKAADLTYCIGSLSAVLSLDKAYKVSDTYYFCLYNDRLMMLTDAATGDESVTRGSSSIKATFADLTIWLPGHYFMIVRCGNGHILRFDLQLDEHHCFQVEGHRLCNKMSDEDILSGRLCRKRNEWKGFSQLPGMGQWKKWLLKRARLYELNSIKECHGMKGVSFSENFLFTSRQPSSLTAMVPYFKGIAEIDGELKGACCCDFYDSTLGNSYERLNNFFKGQDSLLNPFYSGQPEAKRLYYFTSIGILTGGDGKAITGRIRSYWPNAKASAIFCGTQQNIASLMEQNPSWQGFFPEENRLAEEAPAMEELVHNFFMTATILHLNFSPEATDKMCRLLIRAYQEGVICHWGTKDVRNYIRNRLMPSHCQNAIRSLMDGGKEQQAIEVSVEDINERQLLSQTSVFTDTLQELNAMVGLTTIKQNITTLFNRMRFYATRRELGLRTTDGAAFHAIFTGNPGTGKTTVARMMGKIYHSLGLLSKGEVVCLDRAKIVGRYLGETEDNMKRFLQEAQGNVLFIDEAYTLYSSHDDNDYGRKAVECLLNVLSQKDPDMLIIFAGYKNEMDKLMSMNPGLVGRFPYRFHFSDYTAEELMQIADKILTTDQYILTTEAYAALRESVSDTAENHTESFANARWVEQFVRNGIIPAMADRVTSTSLTIPDAYQRIEASDVQAAYEKFNPRVIELAPRHRIVGFNK